MSLRSLPLRFKLVIALVLPMLLVTVLIGDRVSASIDDRRIAAAQQEEAARLEAVASFADAVGSESVVTNDSTATGDQLDAARAETDGALEVVKDPMLGFDPDVVRRIGVHHADVVEIRELVGNRPADIALRFQVEVFIDRSADDVDPATMFETVPSALGRLNSLPTSILEEFDFDPEAVVDVETTRLLADYDLVQRFRADHVREVSVLLQLSATPASSIDDEMITSVREQLAETDVSRSLIYEYGAEGLVTRISEGRRSIAGSEYAQLRSSAENTSRGVVPMSDVTAINRSGAVVTSQYAQLSDDVVASIRAQAEDTSGAAKTSLVLVLLAGAWMLVVAALILRMLYRSIRSPLQRLTEQSQHIANVELPYVVAAMRAGDLEEAPSTTDLVADANDEIGALVHAFNDMHRTAVALAAEQAGSRRVVADMFVNLGRRNQRLVNRLLKRLTILERDERDPDKLAGLYEIDHVVTRMRRNAESLLVLAGASQSRKWDRPVEIYNIAQAALSEVEGYERVEIISGDDFQIHGDVVSDLTHLLAEVVENAVSFSPPSAQVDVSIRRIGDEHLVSVADLGVGMTEAQLAEANDRIWRAGAEEETPSEFLGHYVVGRLAARHGIGVRLSTGLGGRGLVADVVIPVGAVVLAAGELVDEFAEASTTAAPAVESIAPIAGDPITATHPELVTATEVRPLAPVAETLDQQPRRVPASGQPVTAAPPLTPAPAPPPAPAAVPASAPAPEPAVAAVAVVPEPAAHTTRSAATASLALLATPSAGSSFDYPPADQIDPRQREHSARPSTDLSAARDSAADAVEGALSAFGSARRTPGASLPDTSLAAAISGRMTLESDPPQATPPQATPPPAPATEPLTAPTPDPSEIRFQLSGFQSGTRRADREN